MAIELDDELYCEISKGVGFEQAFKDNNIVAVNIDIYAEAYYSEKTYSEKYTITAEDFIKYMSNDVLSETTTISDLDGKHSECDACETITLLTADELGKSGNNFVHSNRNGTTYIYKFADNAGMRCSEFVEMLDTHADEMYNIFKVDPIVSITVKIRQSLKDKFYEAAKASREGKNVSVSISIEE